MGTCEDLNWSGIYHPEYIALVLLLLDAHYCHLLECLMIHLCILVVQLLGYCDSIRELR